MFENKESVYNGHSLEEPKEEQLPEGDMKELQLIRNKNTSSSLMKRVAAPNDVLSYSEFGVGGQESNKSKDSSIADESGDLGIYSVSEDNKSIINDINHQRETSKFFGATTSHMGEPVKSKQFAELVMDT